MIKKLLLCGIISGLFFITDILPQNESSNISGFIKDRVTGEPLIGTNILVYKDTIDAMNAPYAGGATNNYGYYVIPRLSAGRYYLIIRYIGYKPVIREVQITQDDENIALNVEMYSEDIRLDEVIVTEQRENVNVSTIDVTPELLTKLPSLTGEVDLFRLLQTLPGVKTANELSSGLYIRGGSPDQTLTLVDGVILYNPSHLGNIASTFNSNAIRDIKLIKGGFPAQYGGRLSSVLDIKLRSGTKEKEKGIIGLGLINSYLTLEGPISPKATYMISARGMYYDALQRQIDKNGHAPRYNFYDLNSKVTYEYSDRNKISFAFLFNKDKLYNPPASSDIDYDVQWDNVVLSLNWLHINSKQLFFNTTISYIDYSSQSFINKNPQAISDVRYSAVSNLVDLNVKQDVELFWHRDHILKTGLELFVHNYDILYSNVYDSMLTIDPNLGSQFTSFEAATFFQNESEWSSNLKTNIGGRLYYLASDKYFEFEPRLSASLALTGNFSLKAAFSIANQYLHLISRNDITLPADIWFPSTSDIKPGRSVQYVLGLDANTNDLQYIFTIEGYYKKMTNLYEFKQVLDYDIFENNIEQQFTSGIGESYGIELFLNKRSGNLTGWIGYTISWTRRKFKELNNGMFFYPKYDRLHDFSVVVAYDFSSSFSAGATWVYTTGARYNLPPGQFLFSNIGFGEDKINYSFDGLNKAFLPEYHKLDISFTYKTLFFDKQFELYLNFYNVYNRNNPFAQYLTSEKDSDTNETILKLKRISLFPFIPTIGFNYKF
ncbi:MAG: TonB-dependent receptor [Ignavibacteriaceae bacterium]